MSRPLREMQFLVGTPYAGLRTLLRGHRADPSLATLRRLGQLVFVAAMARLAMRPAAAGDGAPVPQPVFIVGHWRSGTSALQRLLACDPRFATPTFLDCAFPLRSGQLAAWFLRHFTAKLPPTRGFDAFPLGADAEFEDEFALLKLTLESPMLAYVFPREARRLWGEFMEGAPSPAWRASMAAFVQALARRAPVQLLKSPAHAFRIACLAEMFPHARFIDIQRDPVATFLSTCALEDHLLRNNALQAPCGVDEELVLARMAHHARAVNAAATTLPAGRFARIGFDDLRADARAVLEGAMTRLGLAPFQPEIARFEACLAELRAHARERQAPTATRERVQRALAAALEAA